METYTLGFLFRNRKIILAEKKRKIGVGKLNGYGGRVEEGEDKGECLVREIHEECSVVVESRKCKELGVVNFCFEGKSELNKRVYMYRIDEFQGTPVETGEMGKPEEFDINEIPYDRMMAGDKKFMRFLIEGIKFKGEIHFSKDGEFKSSVVNEVTDKNNEIKLK